jgi:hypothetical protein
MNPQSRPRSNDRVVRTHVVPREEQVSRATSQEIDNVTETATESNGHDSETETKVSALKPIREAWLAAGGKMPSPADGEKLKAAYKAAKAAVEKADNEASAARAKLSDVCRVIMEKTGARTVTIDGVDHI